MGVTRRGLPVGGPHLFGKTPPSANPAESGSDAWRKACVSREAAASRRYARALVHFPVDSFGSKGEGDFRRSDIAIAAVAYLRYDDRPYRVLTEAAFFFDRRDRYRSDARNPLDRMLTVLSSSRALARFYLYRHGGLDDAWVSDSGSARPCGVADSCTAGRTAAIGIDTNRHHPTPEPCQVRLVDTCRPRAVPDRSSRATANCEEEEDLRVVRILRAGTATQGLAKH